MFEVIKKRLFNAAYKRFFEFHFSSTDVLFPATKFSKLNPKYFDENIIKDLEPNDILVSDDKELRRLVKNSLSFAEFQKNVRRPLIKGYLGLSPNASMFFTDSLNWCLDKAKMIDFRFNFTPVINQEFQNEIITFNTPYTTPIVLPEPEEAEMNIKEIDCDPLQDISGIAQYDDSFIDNVSYDFPYRETKLQEIEYKNYEIYLKGFEEKTLTDEIFPITNEVSFSPDDFAKSAGYMKLTRIRKRGTDIYRDNGVLKFHYEKEKSSNDIVSCVKNDSRVSKFIERQCKPPSNIFNDNVYTLMNAPEVNGPFNVDLEEIKIPTAIRSLRLISKLYEDLVYQCSVKMRHDEVVIRTNGLPFGFILSSGSNRKSLKTIRSYRLFFHKDSIGVWDPKESFGDFNVSRCYTESIEDIKFKSVLFDNLSYIFEKPYETRRIS